MTPPALAVTHRTRARRPQSRRHHPPPPRTPKPQRKPTTPKGPCPTSRHRRSCGPRRLRHPAEPAQAERPATDKSKRERTKSSTQLPPVAPRDPPRLPATTQNHRPSRSPWLRVASVSKLPALKVIDPVALRDFAWLPSASCCLLWPSFPRSKLQKTTGASPASSASPASPRLLLFHFAASIRPLATSSSNVPQTNYQILLLILIQKFDIESVSEPDDHGKCLAAWYMRSVVHAGCRHLWGCIRESCSTVPLVSG